MENLDLSRMGLICPYKNGSSSSRRRADQGCKQ